MCVFWISFSNSIFSAVIKGKINDAKSGEKLIGSTINIKELNKGTTSGPDGSYTIKNVPKGSYTLICSYVSYKTIEKKIALKENDNLKADFKLSELTQELKEVAVISQRDRTTDISARLSEKEASQVINVMSAKTIETLPDLNVANVLQRISGVSMVKNYTGNNTEAIIRGMPPRYNSVLINGISAPSTSQATRSVPLDIIPSNLVGRIEVTKALTPDQEANGLGGTVNIEMKNAPEQPLFSIDLATGYNQFFFDNKLSTFNTGVVNMKDPAQIHGNDYLANLSDFTRGNMIITQKQALPDLNGSFSFGRRFFNKKLGVMISATANNSDQGVIDNSYSYTYLTNNTNDLVGTSNIKYFTQTLRLGSNIKLDYQINDKNRISLYNSFFQSTQDQVRRQSDTTSEISWGRVGASDVTNVDISTLTSTNLLGHHEVTRNLDVDWSVIYSVATDQSPDLVTENFVQIIHPTVQPVYLNYDGCVTRLWQHNTDEDKTVYLNVKYKPFIFDHYFEFKVGGMARNKFRNNYGNEYTFDAPLDNPPNPDMSTVVVTQNRNNQQRSGDPVNFPGNYRATEDIQAGYVQLKTNIGKLQILTGARVEFTYQTNYHSETQNALIPWTQNRFSYYDILPSLHLNYLFTDQQNLRMSVYQGISRPDYTELVDYYAQSVYGGTIGNPNLNHSTGTCFDARYEMYPTKEEVFTAGIFYKNIENAIVDELQGNNATKPVNLTNPVTNYGFELVAIKYFGNFGISGNYTYTNSDMKYSKLWYPDPNSQPIKRPETIPLVGQSPNIVNGALIYRNVAKGFKCQLVYTMQGKNLKQISDFYGQDIYQQAFNDLGATIEKRIYKKFLCFAKINNLLNSKLEYCYKDGLKYRDTSTSMSFLAGIKFNL